MRITRWYSGFTIIELLLALFLTTLLTAALSLMIGQAAKDRRAMLEPTAEPAWMVAALDRLERDLQTARWWAGVDDRLVLIGLGRDGNPAHVEYRWQQEGDQQLWLRQENVLTGNINARLSGSRSVLAVNPSGIEVGPYRFGDIAQQEERGVAIGPNQGSRASVSATTGTFRGGDAVVVGGHRVSLRALPDQIDLRLEAPFGDGDSRTVTRRVVLR